MVVVFIVDGDFMQVLDEFPLDEDGFPTAPEPPIDDYV